MASPKAKFFVYVIFGIFVGFFYPFLAFFLALVKPAKILRVTPTPQARGTLEAPPFSR